VMTAAQLLDRDNLEIILVCLHRGGNTAAAIAGPNTASPVALGWIAVAAISAACFSIAFTAPEDGRGGGGGGTALWMVVVRSLAIPCSRCGYTGRRRAGSRALFLTIYAFRLLLSLARHSRCLSGHAGEMAQE
jgi:hypothetical protein